MTRGVLTAEQQAINDKIEKIIQHYRLDIDNKANLMYWEAQTTHVFWFGGKAVPVTGGRTYHIPSGVYKIMQGIKNWKTMCPASAYNENSLHYFLERLRDLLREASLSHSLFRREATTTLYNTTTATLEGIAASSSASPS